MGFSDTEVENIVRQVLAEILALSEERAAALVPESGLFGAMPEFDSMAVAAVLTGLEDRLGIFIDDDEVDGDLMESFGALVAFAQRKTSA